MCRQASPLPQEEELPSAHLPVQLQQGLGPGAGGERTVLPGPRVARRRDPGGAWRGRSFLQREAHACASPGCCRSPSLSSGPLGEERGRAGHCSGLRGARCSTGGAGAPSARAGVAGLATRQPQGQALPAPVGRLGSVPSPAGSAATAASAEALRGTPPEGLVGAGSLLRARGVGS